ncbi:zinc finger protein ZFAT [Platysternon megacephalum]|uniref:Zinc finger protein ZFAT n=1 Tax=Platysternon megacephalum TaxID=55544 RepID=A0A4D9EAD5_9SAUR|nr:zinc finger protein ZFAT [Platysternon megacephalum]
MACSSPSCGAPVSRGPWQRSSLSVTAERGSETAPGRARRRAVAVAGEALVPVGGRGQSVSLAPVHAPETPSRWLWLQQAQEQRPAHWTLPLQAGILQPHRAKGAAAPHHGPQSLWGWGSHPGLAGTGEGPLGGFSLTVPSPKAALGTALPSFGSFSPTAEPPQPAVGGRALPPAPWDVKTAIAGPGPDCTGLSLAGLWCGGISRGAEGSRPAQLRQRQGTAVRGGCPWRQVPGRTGSAWLWADDKERPTNPSLHPASLPALGMTQEGAVGRGPRLWGVDPTGRQTRPPRCFLLRPITARSQELTLPLPAPASLPRGIPQAGLSARQSQAFSLPGSRQCRPSSSRGC